MALPQVRHKSPSIPLQRELSTAAAPSRKALVFSGAAAPLSYSDPLIAISGRTLVTATMVLPLACLERIELRYIPAERTLGIAVAIISAILSIMSTHLSAVGVLLFVPTLLVGLVIAAEARVAYALCARTPRGLVRIALYDREEDAAQAQAALRAAVAAERSKDNDGASRDAA